MKTKIFYKTNPTVMIKNKFNDFISSNNIVITNVEVADVGGGFSPICLILN